MLDGLPRPSGGDRKKLEEVARHWARGDLTSEQEHANTQAGLDEQFAYFGLVPDQPAVPEPEPVYLWPENVPAWNLWLSVQTQWRGSMQREGLDYAGVQCVVASVRSWRTRQRRLFAHVQVMERACLDEWAKQHAADAQG